MNRDHYELEVRRQTQAESAAHGTNKSPIDAQVDAYRLVHRVVRTASIPPLPQDFAERVARAVDHHDERARLESWCVGVALVCAAIAAAIFALPVLADTFAALAGRLDALPWPMLLTCCAGLFAVWVVDSLLPRSRTLRS